MDLLRNCTANVQVVDGLQNIPFRVYSPPPPPQVNSSEDPSYLQNTTLNSAARLQEQEASLRQAGAVVTIDSANGGLLLFGGPHEAETQIGYPVYTRGFLGSTGSRRSVQYAHEAARNAQNAAQEDGRDADKTRHTHESPHRSEDVEVIYKHFVKANSGAIPLDVDSFRILIDNDDGTIRYSDVVYRLDVHLSLEGRLYISAAVKHCKLPPTGHTLGKTNIDATGLRWYLETFQSPLSAAQSWFLGATERREARILKEASDMQEQTASAIGSAPPSPFYFRDVQMQGTVAAGVYPTPPDGFPTGFPASAVDPHRPADSGTALALAERNFIRNAVERPASASPNKTGPHGYATTHDDLFGDMDEDVFGGGGQDITDADFSFFDEPDEANFETDMQSESHAAALDTSPQADDIPGSYRDPGIGQCSVTLDAIGQPLPSGLNSEITDIEKNNSILNKSASAQHNEAESRTTFDTSTVIAHVETPPLDPFAITERLMPAPVFTSAQHGPATGFGTGKRRSSGFASVPFKQTVALSDAKYGRSGRFAFVLPSDDNDVRTEKRFGRQDYTITLPPRVKRTKSAMSGCATLINTKRQRHYLPTSDEDDDSSEEDSYTDTSSDPEHRLPKYEPSFRPRTPIGGSGDGSMKHLESSCNGMNSEYIDGRAGPEVIESANEISQQPARNNAPDLWRFFDLTPQDLIQTAQLVADQAIRIVDTDPGTTASEAYVWDTNSSVFPDHEAVHSIVRHAVKLLFPTAVDCDILRLVDHRTSSSMDMTNTNPKVPRPRVSTTEHRIFMIEAPYVRLSRAESDWEMLPPALTFWESLGLGPASGEKDVLSYCMLPSVQQQGGSTNLTDIAKLATDFLWNLASTYESCKLGLFATGSNLTEYPNGLVSVRNTREEHEIVTVDKLVEMYAQTATEFGLALSTIGHLHPQKTIVLFMFNPFPLKFGFQRYLCATFLKIHQAYSKPPKIHPDQPGSELVLNILPTTLIVDFDSFVISEPSVMATLARAIYDRCPSISSSAAAGLDIPSASSVTLARPVSKRLDFRLSPSPSADLMYENSVMHLAYAVSLDKAWISAAWTDNEGVYQFTATYCALGREFEDVAREIWKTSVEIMSARQVSWRALVVKEGVMETSERKAWTSLAIADTPAFRVDTTLLAIDTEPGLRLIPALPAAPPGVQTPVSTPGYNISPSDNPAGNAPLTPAASEVASILELDPDAHLVDTEDETWGLILGSQYCLPCSPADDNGMLASGCLVRRGARDDVGGALQTVRVDLLWMSSNSDGVQRGKAEVLLKEVLVSYRGLALLARIKATPPGVPWHVVAARRGCEALVGFL
ncbi:mediator of RNA polymerase II transcription subunit 13 [Elasticomyces elasticus]|nr:mediator of RNA polymerase II transcription subunit 13 [Elasticomyces elasticus]